MFNTDQGSQFTSQEFTQVLKDLGVKISMDGKGRYADNIFVERLWRTVKYEEVYLKAYASAGGGGGPGGNWGAYFRFYNDQTPHQALGYRTPGEVFSEGRAPQNEESTVGMWSPEPDVVCYAGAAGPSLNSTSIQKWLRKSEQGDKWNRCLIEGMIVLSETGARDEQTTPP